MNYAKDGEIWRKEGKICLNTQTMGERQTKLAAKKWKFAYNEEMFQILEDTTQCNGKSLSG